jgi:gelsolin
MEDSPLQALGGKGPIAKADEVDSDENFEREVEKSVNLFQVSDATGTLEVRHVAIPPLKQEFLDGDDCHILDIGTEIFVWIGHGCTQQEKESAMVYAQKFLKDANRPDWTPIERLRQGMREEGGAKRRVDKLGKEEGGSRTEINKEEGGN